MPLAEAVIFGYHDDYRYYELTISLLYAWPRAARKQNTARIDKVARRTLEALARKRSAASSLTIYARKMTSR